MLVNLRAESLFGLDGKTAVLTGATGFLGRTFARALLANGARVVALGRSDRLHDLGADWARDFGRDKIDVRQVDAYDREAYGAVLADVAAKEAALEVVVNNAHELGPATGFNVPEGHLETASFEQWMRNLTAGIYWAAQAVQILGVAMKQRRRGSIVNISTMYATVAPSPLLYEGTTFINPPGYSAAKAGLLAFTRYVASFWGPFGIRANAILPGPFSNTDDDGPNAVKTGDEFLDRLRMRTCLRRIGAPKELCGALLFLASDASSFVTGHALAVDGGWTIT